MATPIYSLQVLRRALFLVRISTETRALKAVEFTPPKSNFSECRTPKKVTSGSDLCIAIEEIIARQYYQPHLKLLR